MSELESDNVMGHELTAEELQQLAGGSPALAAIVLFGGCFLIADYMCKGNSYFFD